MSFFDFHLPDVTGIIHDYTEHQREDTRIDKADKAMVAKFQGRGGGSPEAIQAALGNYADIHKHKVDAVEQGDMTESETGARNIQRDYTSGKNPTADKVPVGDLDNPAQRLVVLEHLTQTGEGKDASDQGQCGPSSLIGGALLAGGTEGLGQIMDATLAHCSPEHREALAKQMEGIRKAMKEGKLNFGHLQTLQDDLYTVMQRDMEHEDPDVIKKAMEDPQDEEKQRQVRLTGGTDRKTIEQFLADSDDLRESFKKNGLSISHVNNNAEKTYEGGDSADHFVLSMKDKKGNLEGVYDPWERAHGQVVTNATELKGYSQAEHRNITGEG